MPAFKLDDVRGTWQKMDREKRRASREARRLAGLDPYDGDSELGYSYVKEVWADPNYVIVDADSEPSRCFKIEFTADDKGDITFGTAQEVKHEYVAASGKGTLVWESQNGPQVDKLIALAGTERVSGYFKRSKTGQSTKVGAYQRSPGDMNTADIVKELSTTKDAARKQQLTNELRKPSHQATLHKAKDHLAKKAGYTDAADADYAMNPPEDPNKPKASKLSLAEQATLNKLVAKGAANLSPAEKAQAQALLAKRKGKPAPVIAANTSQSEYQKKNAPSARNGSSSASSSGMKAALEKARPGSTSHTPDPPYDPNQKPSAAELLRRKTKKAARPKPKRSFPQYD